jgi:pyruvate formate lyase activating enzyme
MIQNSVPDLDELTRPGELVQPEADGRLRCLACSHRCLLGDGRRGICQVRYHAADGLRVPWGYTAGYQLDPVEKKPFYHFLPGASAFTFGMLGCNFHCDFCQNWQSSQSPRLADAHTLGRWVEPITPEELANRAARRGAAVLASSYNEPVITAEWAHAIFTQAKQKGLRTVMVSNGYASPECLDYLRPVLDGYKVDLKSMREENYRALGGQLKHVLDAITGAHARGYWVEVVTLVIPGFNDDPAELWDAASAIRAISPDIPWHVTGFHPDYRMLDRDSTAPSALLQAAEIGQEAGLKFVYAGNLPGRVGSLENTYCPGCRALLIERSGYQIRVAGLLSDGRCAACGAQIPGVWSGSGLPPSAAG